MVIELTPGMSGTSKEEERMVENTREARDLVLAQNQHAFIQDDTKGIVQLNVGPTKMGLTAADRPVRFDGGSRKFVICSLEDAIAQNPVVSEDSYVVLENPAEDQGKQPKVGSQSPADLQVGRKINIPGPITFALWPGQIATVIGGHQLKSNEYLIARIYNVEEANKNWPGTIDIPKEVVIGQLLIIKGTDVSFFIPPTGIEIVKDVTSDRYVRQANTLEQLEYCILLDEDGTKRYERGPQVVFPTATEKFIARKGDSNTAHGEAIDRTAAGYGTNIKFKATELNPQMGIYIKVIDDYEEAGKKYSTGDELFITGKETRIYYPRVEHAVIEYVDSNSSFKRQRYYGIAIPKGEARYVLNKDTGTIDMIRGEQILLPDPRSQVIVRRVLAEREVKLWYPGNIDAIAYNKQLAGLADVSQSFVTDSAYAGAATAGVGTPAGAIDTERSFNRTLGNSVKARGLEIEGGNLKRGTQYTPPPGLTLNTKYDGVPRINVFTGYAVQVVNNTGERKVVQGPAAILLEYDQTLEKISMSAGNPKTTDRMIQDVYLRVSHNKVSDTIEVETADMVTSQIKVSLRVNFEGDSSKWFSVENYTKFMCDHTRSLVRAAVKKLSIKELIDNTANIVRDTILGLPTEGKKRPGLAFEENNMRVYDVEVLKLTIMDPSVAQLISSTQNKAVADTLTVTAKQGELVNAVVVQKIELELAELRSETELFKLRLNREQTHATHAAAAITATEQHNFDKMKSENQLLLAKIEDERQALALERLKLEEEHRLEVKTAETEMFVKRMGTVDPKLTAALTTLADSKMMTDIAGAIAPIAVMEQEGVGPVLTRLFKGTRMAEKLEALLDAPSADKSL